MRIRRFYFPPAIFLSQIQHGLNRYPTLYAVRLYKTDIRALSKDLGLPTWEKQSFACLSSRFVYGETITKEKLGMVDKAEQLLLDMRDQILGGQVSAKDGMTSTQDAINQLLDAQ